MRSIEVFKRHVKEKRAIKIIAGIDNYDLTNVACVCRAAQMGLASAVDVAANEDVIKVALQNTKLPVFASSVQPFDLKKAVKWGATAIEIGNYDSLYEKGTKFGADEIYDITLETMTLTEKDNVYLSVTIPGCISIEEQIKLAKKLELLGVDLIQTEGIKPINVNNKTIASDMLSASHMTISNTLEIAKVVSTPIMSASGISANNVQLAFDAGASAVGVGTYVNKLRTQVAMNQAVREIVGAIAYKDIQKLKEEKVIKSYFI